MLGTVQALTGGRLEGREEIALASLDELRVGVLTKAGRHLLTAFSSDGRSVLVPTEALVELGGERVLERPGGVRRFLDEVGPQGWERIGATITDRPLDSGSRPRPRAPRRRVGGRERRRAGRAPGRP